MPSSPQHTPGPWTLVLGQRGEAWVEAQQGDILVAECTENAKANATLIAAAPEMLAALTDLLYVAEEEGLEHAWGPAVEAARKALDKASTAV